jgi:hypothetical protein
MHPLCTMMGHNGVPFFRLIPGGWAASAGPAARDFCHYGFVSPEVAMSEARITIGGVDVSPHPNDVIINTQRDFQRHAANSSDHTFSRPDAGEASVLLTLERPAWSTCPLPPGPWRIIGTAVLGGLILSLIVCLIQHRAHPSQESNRNA